MATVVLVSDSHLSQRAPEAGANWDAVVRYVTDCGPDLVVHLGDLSLDGPNDPTDFDHARARLDELPAPWRAVPGNHDIGDNPWPGSPSDDGVDADGLQRWRSAIGADWWSAQLDGWTLVGLNAELFDSRLDAEVEQWAWLEDTLAAIPPSTPLLLLTHKPVAAAESELSASPPDRFLPLTARRRLGDLLTGRSVPMVISGHIHQYRELDLDGRHHVWAPTTWAVVPDSVQPRIGLKRCGVLRLDLGPRGHSEVTFVEPPGMSQLTIGTDFPNPYEH